MMMTSYTTGLLILTTGLFVGATVASKETEQRKDKAFSIFSLLHFDNNECTSLDPLASGLSYRKGICFTANECTDKGGTGSGNCASGFGVCCVFKVSAATGTINKNNTYVQNPSFPKVYSGTDSTLSYKIAKASLNICYLRLDFETFTIIGTADIAETDGGGCTKDAFKIMNPTMQQIPTICGMNTGQHMYIDFGTDKTETISMVFSFSGSSNIRAWDIKTSQIECSNLSRPPAGCLQYFTTLSGRITTFNFLDDSFTHLAGQDYNACVRQYDGYCCIQYQACADQENSFSLDVRGNGAYLNDDFCNMDYISIPGSSEMCNNSPFYLKVKYCGHYLGIFQFIAANLGNTPICDCSPPFTVGIHTDNAPDLPAQNIKSRGVCLDYSQVPCTRG